MEILFLIHVNDPFLKFEDPFRASSANSFAGSTQGDSNGEPTRTWMQGA